ncbi:pyridoxal phosphate-dependent transferase [Cunninghamella echinulata]|nr:pyridoxal phosphate-dependent transferase [Cunninghamella echinulata]
MNKGQQTEHAHLFLETAGGIHSPVMSGTSQVDFYRPFRYPTILIGDSKLGGISTTLTSYESLHIRGYDVPAILLFNNEKYRNHELVSHRLQDKKMDITTVPPPPLPNVDPILDQQAMKKYYEQLDEYLVPVIEKLDFKHQERFDRLSSMAEKSRNTFWWPFTQHNLVKKVTVMDSAYNDHFVTYEKDNNNNEQQQKGNKVDVKAKEMFDSCASWWTQGLGHGNPSLTLAAANAAGRYGHVMFPESTNEPALALSEKVLEKNAWASRVFFSDNGSTAMEVALKMAMKSAAKRYGWDNQTPVDILGIDGSYHGDTIGTMDACSPNVYNEQVQWYKPRGHWLQPPTVHISKGKAYVQLPKVFETLDPQLKTQQKQSIVNYENVSSIYSVDQFGHDINRNLSDLYKEYIRQQLTQLKQQGRHIGALLMEPVLMGAGGMIFVDPLFQRTLVDVTREEGQSLLGYVPPSPSPSPTTSSVLNSNWQGIPIVFDEVFTGWYRLGRQSASDFLGVKPDIAAYAKTLTGGLIPLALTVTKESIFETFLSDNKPDCLLHGHSYTAHPMGSAVAKKSIDILDTLASDGTWAPYQQSWKKNENNSSNVWSMWNWDTVQHISHLPNVEHVMALGSVLAVSLKDDQGKGYGSSVSASVIDQLRHGAFLNQSGTSINLFARPLGNVIYLMTSQITTPNDVQECERILLSCLQNK